VITYYEPIFHIKLSLTIGTPKDYTKNALKTPN